MDAYAQLQHCGKREHGVRFDLSGRPRSRCTGEGIEDPDAEEADATQAASDYDDEA
jgi:hypothetical protein